MLIVDKVFIIIGQALGIVAVILGFVNYQMKTRKQVLYVHIATVVCLSIHYFLIGAYVGMALNTIAIIRNIVYYFTGKNPRLNRIWAAIFAVIMGIAGALSWEGWYSVFIIAGLVINSYCMSFQNPNNLRKSILISCPMAVVYNCFVMSIGGIIYESVAILSAAIGLLRFRKNKTA